MNDEFLHALRRDPPPEFARQLKRRLQRQPARNPRSSFARTLLALLLIGGVAVAAAVLFRNRSEPPRVEAPIARQAPSTPARAVEPAAAPSPPATRDSGAVPQPAAAEAQTKIIPLAFVTSSLAQPLAEALIEGVMKYPGGFARPRLMTMDDTEALRAVCGNADFAMVSRRITDAELALCRKWGVDLVEWKLGYQAVVLTAGLQADPTPLTPRDVFLALARRIPDPAEPSRLIDNPNTTWHDVDARFDYRTIDVLAPPDAQTRALFVQLVMEAGCDTYPWIRSLRSSDRARYFDICHQLRSDGRYRETEVRNTLFITQRLWSEPDWLVVLNYAFYAEHRSELLDTKLEGPAATRATLADGTYPAARPVYVYAQRSHLDWASGAQPLVYALANVPGFASNLQGRGLVPLDDVPRRTPSGPPVLPPTLESLR
jgi:phosphate transport system substrate-binding protein